ncbi:MAG: type II secretion system F family protein [Pirellulaceae bacterium]|jgi:tight adherence protein C|nr:type II secretion system F family protein [Pirellulaceae bacterium]MDP6557635.1 type II secretion system F family protein [Pirellulaceae bacterium]MDP6718646.1 type II secretion system F family protein [Pirellulaceae bacterium]
MSAIFESTTVISLAVGAAVIACAWLLLDILSAKKPRAEERLEEFKDPSLRRTREERTSTTGAMARALKKATPALAKPLQPKTEQEVGKLRSKLMHAGFRSDSAPTMFLGIKFMSLITGLVFSGGGVLVAGVGAQSMLRAGFFACGMFFLPDVLLMLLGRRRKEAIFLALPDALDLMVVCVEAGLALDQAMRKVAEEMKKTYRVVAEEFGICNMQLQMGVARSEALQNLGSRSGVDDLKSLASILIQADKFGSSIAQALRVQSESMRVRRAQIAEEKAAKTAVKLIFPLVLFIFPGIFVVLVGPAGIKMYREMFTALNNGG